MTLIPSPHLLATVLAEQHPATPAAVSLPQFTTAENTEEEGTEAENVAQNTKGKTADIQTTR